MSDDILARAEKWAEWLAFHPDDEPDNVSLQTLVVDMTAEVAALRARVAELTRLRQSVPSS